MATGKSTGKTTRREPLSSRREEFYVTTRFGSVSGSIATGAKYPRPGGRHHRFTRRARNLGRLAQRQQDLRHRDGRRSDRRNVPERRRRPAARPVHARRHAGLGERQPYRVRRQQEASPRNGQAPAGIVFSRRAARIFRALGREPGAVIDVARKVINTTGVEPDGIAGTPTGARAPRAGNTHHADSQR